MEQITGSIEGFNTKQLKTTKTQKNMKSYFTFIGFMHVHVSVYVYICV